MEQILASMPSNCQTDLPTRWPVYSLKPTLAISYGIKAAQVKPPGSLSVALIFDARIGWSHEWRVPSIHPHDMPVRMLRVWYIHPRG